MKFETPMELHYSQTPPRMGTGRRQFETPMELHYSQTTFVHKKFTIWFETPMELHYSQTSNSRNTTKILSIYP